MGVGLWSLVFGLWFLIFGFLAFGFFSFYLAAKRGAVVKKSYNIRSYFSPQRF